MNIDFSREAETDIASINRESIQLFGARQAAKYASGLARAFRSIADFPFAYPVREGMLRMVRIRPYEAHVILYEVVDGTVLILRIRHGREDWMDD